MSSFWYTKKTMRDIFGETFAAFRPFDATHLCELALCAAVCAAGAVLYRRADAAARRRILLAVTVLILADELVKYVFTLATGQFEWGFLPLHLCSINIFVCAWYTARRFFTVSSLSSSRWMSSSPVASSLPTTFGGLNLT